MLNLTKSTNVILKINNFLIWKCNDNKKLKKHGWKHEIT